MILTNKACCKKCGDVIESKSVHDWVSCKCGEIFVDGGHDYLRRGATDFKNFEDLSEIECPECLGKGYHYEGFHEKEVCFKCQGTGKL